MSLEHATQRGDWFVGGDLARLGLRECVLDARTGRVVFQAVRHVDAPCESVLELAIDN